MVNSAAAFEALAPLRSMLAADGYELDLRADEDSNLVAEIKPGPAACAECLVSKDIMRTYFDAALRAVFGKDSPEVRLIYPADL